MCMNMPLNCKKEINIGTPKGMFAIVLWILFGFPYLLRSREGPCFNLDFQLQAVNFRMSALKSDRGI